LFFFLSLMWVTCAFPLSLSTSDDVGAVPGPRILAARNVCPTASCFALSVCQTSGWSRPLGGPRCNAAAELGAWGTVPGFPRPRRPGFFQSVCFGVSSGGPVFPGSCSGTCRPFDPGFPPYPVPPSGAPVRGQVSGEPAERARNKYPSLAVRRRVPGGGLRRWRCPWTPRRASAMAPPFLVVGGPRNRPLSFWPKSAPVFRTGSAIRSEQASRPAPSRPRRTRI